jgi:hypothetical protein
VGYKTLEGIKASRSRQSWQLGGWAHLSSGAAHPKIGRTEIRPIVTQIYGLATTNENGYVEFDTIVPGSRSYERIANDKDPFYLESKSQPMTVTREKGVLVAKAAIGMVSQGNHSFRTPFR